MGFWGIVFACFMIPAILVCLSTKKYMVVGVVMGLNWMAYTIPFRELINFPDKNYYFVIVASATAISLYAFSSHLIMSRIIIGLISILLCFCYSPLILGYVTLRQAMVFADLIGAIQILAMLGGGFGELVRLSKYGIDFPSLRNLTGRTPFHSWFITMGFKRVRKPGSTHQVPISSFEEEKS